jgi:hypothetical protein
MENIGNIIQQRRKDDEINKESASKPFGAVGHLGEESRSEMIPTESDKENIRNMKMKAMLDEGEVALKGEEKREERFLSGSSDEKVLGEKKGKEFSIQKERETALERDERVLIPSQLPLSSEEKRKREEREMKAMGCFSLGTEEKDPIIYNIVHFLYSC